MPRARTSCCGGLSFKNANLTNDFRKWQKEEKAYGIVTVVALCFVIVEIIDQKISIYQKWCLFPTTKTVDVF